MSRDNQNIKTTDWLTRGIPKEQLKREKEEAIKEAEAELRNKQIEEMARVIEKMPWRIEQDGLGCRITNNTELAEYFYNAGYCKSTDVAEEIFAEIESKLTLNKTTHCGQKFYYIRLKDDIAELKKKYIGKNTNVTTNTEEGE